MADDGAPFPRARRHKPVPRRRPADRRRSSGSATASVARPAARRRRADSGRADSGRADRRRAKGGRAKGGRSGSAGAVTSLGEVRAHRRWRDEVARRRSSTGGSSTGGSSTGGSSTGGSATGGSSRARPPRRFNPRSRARRITTTRPRLAGRFVAGQPRLRLIGTLVCLLIVLGAVLGKVGLMQSGGRAEALRSAGNDQWTRSRTIAAPRGAIFDRNGAELALSVPATTIVVNPMQVADPEGTAATLGRLLDHDEEWIAELAEGITNDAGRDIGFRYVARQQDPAVAALVAAQGLAGVSTYSEDRRLRPGGGTGLAVIGRTDIDGNGVAGLELQFDDLLQGQPGEMTRQVAPGGRSIAGTEQTQRAPIPGSDIVTSLDRAVQHAAEQALVQQVNRMQAAGGQVVVMLSNGEVIAMTSVERDNRGVAVPSTGNWAAVGSYEPGSVGKIITVAGALEEGAVTPDSQFYVEDSIRCANDPAVAPLTDSMPHDPWTLSVNDILVRSSNVGTVLVGQEMGYERQYHYLTAFGLGQPTGMGFPGESRGILKPWEQWWATERCTVSYGHGVASSPIQLAAAVNVLANDGMYAQPRLAVATVGADGSMTDIDHQPDRYVVSPEVAGQMQEILKNVVCSPHGTAGQAAVPGLAVGGKTGTAFKAQADGGYFNEEGVWDYYVSFVGFFPADAPQVTVLVSIDEPGHGTSGAQAAAPLFRQLVPTIRHELGIVPPPGSTDCDGNHRS